jgi:hypothetical protein
MFDLSHPLAVLVNGIGCQTIDASFVKRGLALVSQYGKDDQGFGLFKPVSAVIHDG